VEVGRARRPVEVDEEEIAEVLSIWTGIPVFKLTEEENREALGWRTSCTSGSVDIRGVVARVSKSIRRTPRRPQGNPSVRPVVHSGALGRRETELSRRGGVPVCDEDALIQLDMSST